MESRQGLDIAIIGGGIAGLTLAIALHQRGVNFTIYEQAVAFGEIGAGVSFSPNAVRAMECCHHGVTTAFEKVCTRNRWESKQKVWFDFHDGFNNPPRPSFTIKSSLGQRAVHRADFVTELVKLLPDHVASFNKRLSRIVESDNGKLLMSFQDGTQATADAVIGCDGIHSRVRQMIFPSSTPSYSHQYAYRGLIPMDRAAEVLGREKSENACMHLGSKGHVLTFPVNHGKVMNVVAFHHSEDQWENPRKNTKPASREQALGDFSGFNKDVTKILQLTEPTLNVWAIFDLHENPVPSFHKGRICISGDAAHATSPHHGAGAGFCVEDSAVLATLLSHKAVKSPTDIEKVFAAFDECRRERCQWLVRSSRFMGEGYQSRAEGVGGDFKKLETEINVRNGIVADIDVYEMCTQATNVLSRLLK